jgi:hypothetical protein
MGMTEAVWRRHANPWSVWTRFATLPFLVLAIWSRVWIGWWSLVPVVLLLVWLFVNPRAFPPPRNPDNWGSKATFGERLWLNEGRTQIPLHHRRAVVTLNTVAALGVLVLTWGLVTLQMWPTVLGTVVVYLGKMWFLDRMVWLYEEMSRDHPEYAAWIQPEES